MKRRSFFGALLGLAAMPFVKPKAATIEDVRVFDRALTDTEIEIIKVTSYTCHPGIQREAEGVYWQDGKSTPIKFRYWVTS